jgi:hypothetical protein
VVPIEPGAECGGLATNNDRRTPQPARAILRGAWREVPSGIRFWVLLASASLEQRLDRHARDAVFGMLRYMRRSLIGPPSPAGLYEIVGAAMQEDNPDTEIARGLKDGIEAYQAVLQDLARTVGEKQLRQALSAISFAAQEPVTSAMDMDNQYWAKWLARTSGHSAAIIASIGKEAGVLAYRPPHAPRTFSKARASDVEVVAELKHWVPRTMTESLPLSIDWMLTLNATELAQSCLPEFPEAAAAITSALQRVSDEASEHPDVVAQAIAALRRDAGPSAAAFEAAFAQQLQREKDGSG